LSEAQATERLDRWLWHARFFKTRTLAAKVVSGGQVRVNSQRVRKPATLVRVGDGLTFPQGRDIRIVTIQAFGLRRGPAAEAQALYQDLDVKPEADPGTPPAVPADRGAGRPTKKQRRALAALKRFDP
jgi:ribosome-associated heat shock protein Hsp15